MPYIKQLDIYNHYKLPDFSIDLSSEPDEFTHLILTGPNGSGKTTLIEKIAQEVDHCLLFHYMKRLAEMRKSGELQRKLRAHQTVELSSTKVLIYGGETQRFGGPEDPIFIGPFFTDLHWDTSDVSELHDDGFFVTAFLSAHRPLDTQSVAGPRKQAFNVAKAFHELAGEFLQYLVNQKTQARLAEPEDESESRKIDAWFDDLEQNLAYLFGIEGLKLEFLRKDFAIRFREPSGTTYDFFQLAAGHASVLKLLGELTLRIDARETERDKLAQGKYGRRRPELSGVILIDELDIHLHPAMQERILPFLTSKFPRLQFIVATHSPAIISSVDNAVVVDLEHPEAAIRSAELQGTPYGRLMTSQFGIETDVDLSSTERLRRLQVLLDKQSRTDAENAEFEALTRELHKTSHTLALEAWNRILASKIADEYPTGLPTDDRDDGDAA